AATRHACAEVQRLHRRAVVDLKGDAGVERKAERQDEPARKGIAVRGVEFDGQNALAVLPCQYLRERTALAGLLLDADDAPVPVCLVERRGAAGQAGIRSAIAVSASRLGELQTLLRRILAAVRIRGRLARRGNRS